MKALNGWTKETMISHVKQNFKGKSVGEYYEGGQKTHGCVYRGPENKKCAVGLFIEDRHYDTKMEGRSVHGLLSKFPEVKSTMPLDSQGLASFQYVHDGLSAQDDSEKLINWIETNVEA